MIPPEIQDDWQHYKTLNPFRCQICDKFSANFVNLNFDKDKILWWFDYKVYFNMVCVLCGESSFHYVTRSYLEKLMKDYYLNERINGDKYPYSLWQIFKMSKYYPESCFKTDIDRRRYCAVYFELEKILNGHFKN